MASLGSSLWQQAVVAGSQTRGLQNVALCPRNLQCGPFSRSHQKRSSCLVRAAEEEPTAVAKPATKPAKPVFSLTKGQIVRVDKEKYLNSVNYLSVDHPPFFKGLDYIYEDRGEVLDLRFFETGEYALIAWAGIPTSPAWLPTEMLIKAAKLNYTRT